MDKNFGGFAFLRTGADIFFEPARLLEDVEMNLDTWAGKYIRTFKIAAPGIIGGPVMVVKEEVVRVELGVHRHDTSLNIDNGLDHIQPEFRPGNRGANYLVPLWRHFVTYGDTIRGKPKIIYLREYL